MMVAKERLTKRVFEVLHAKNFELNETRKTLKDVSGFLLFVRETKK